MSCRVASLGLALLSGAGCQSLDRLDGFKLGKPQSVVYHEASDGRVMVALTDLLDPCSDFASTEPPGASEWWIVSAWSDDVSVLDERVYAAGFASVTTEGATTEYVAESGEITLTRWGDNGIGGELSLLFDTGDETKASFDADYCDFDLFQGM